MKMKFTLLLLLIIMAMPLSAQTLGATDSEPVYNMAMVQQQPKFPGGA